MTQPDFLSETLSIRHKSFRAKNDREEERSSRESRSPKHNILGKRREGLSAIFVTAKEGMPERGGSSNWGRLS